MSQTTANPRGWLSRGADDEPSSALDVVIAWSLAEPRRTGELATLRHGATYMLGRGDAAPGEAETRLLFGRTRPGVLGARLPLCAPAISRRQLRVTHKRGEWLVQRTGRLELRVDGRAADEATVSAGSTLLLGDELLVLLQDATTQTAGAPAFAFGAADEDGYVGESPGAWRLRAQIDAAAARDAHVILFGPSGAGKELCAAGVHRRHGRGPWVGRNAATLPEGIVDAELFGNAKNFPNPGMRERAGLVGEADGGTLFLDEIGELPERLQAHLLRLLDSGEYHRLGEDRARRANLCVIGATNRDPSSLKHDLLARFPARIDVPGFDERRSDIPLVAGRIFERLAKRDATLARFCERDGTLRIDPRLVEALLHHDFEAHARELEQIIVQSIAESTRPFLEFSRGLAARLERTAVPKGSPDRDALAAALDKHDGNLVHTGAALGLSRHAVRRLLVRYGLEKPRR